MMPPFDLILDCLYVNEVSCDCRCLFAAKLIPFPCCLSLPLFFDSFVVRFLTAEILTSFGP